MTDLAAFRTKFDVERLTVLATRTWTWSVRPTPCTLGASVFSTNRWCPTLGALGSAEALDLTELTAAAERAMVTCFGATCVNYLALMIQDRTAHVHVVPRYEHQVTFGGVSWLDAAWPDLPDLGANTHLKGGDVVLEVRDVLRRAVAKSTLTP